MKHFIFLAAAAMMLAVACNTNTSAPAADQTTPATTMLTPTTPNPENAAIAQEFLKKCGTYYLATVEGDQPRVRPFGTAEIIDGKLYIQTGKVKPVSKQLAANPKAEICAFKGGKWLRVSGELVNDDNHDIKVAMLEKMPSLKGMYSADDDNMQMLYFKNAVATFSSFTEAPETFTF